MKRFVCLAVACLFLLSMTGCAFVTPLPSAVYGDVKGGLSTDSAVKSKKTGKSCAQSVMMVASWGDASIEKAKEDGKIKKVATVDFETFNVLVYARYCTVVTGE